MTNLIMQYLIVFIISQKQFFRINIINDVIESLLSTPSLLSSGRGQQYSTVPGALMEPSSICLDFEMVKNMCWLCGSILTYFPCQKGIL